MTRSFIIILSLQPKTNVKIYTTNLDFTKFNIFKKNVFRLKRYLQH
jgi:hypothetical protein